MHSSSTLAAPSTQFPTISSIRKSSSRVLCCRQSAFETCIAASIVPTALGKGTARAHEIVSLLASA